MFKVDAMMDERDELAQDMDTLVALLQSSNDTLAEVMASYEELSQEREDLEETLSQQEAQVILILVADWASPDVVPRI